MVKTLISSSKYKFGKEPEGKTFFEAYDLESVKPVKEYLEIYTRTTKEIKDLLGIIYQ